MYTLITRHIATLVCLFGADIQGKVWIYLAYKRKEKGLESSLGGKRSPQMNPLHNRHVNISTLLSVLYAVYTVILYIFGLVQGLKNCFISSEARNQKK